MVVFLHSKLSRPLNFAISSESNTELTKFLSSKQLTVSFSCFQGKQIQQKFNFTTRSFSFCPKMQASTIEKQGSLRPKSNSTKLNPQKEAMNPSYFAFTAEDLYNCLHQKSGIVEPITPEDTSGKKLEKNSAGKDTRSTCKLAVIQVIYFVFVGSLDGNF